MIEKITNQNQIARHKLAEKINEIIDYINQNNHEYTSIEEVVKARENHVADVSKKVADRMIGCTTLNIPERYKNDQLTLATLDYSKKLEKENSNLKDELERTRKALDVAVDMLKEIDKTRCAVDANLYAVNHKLLNAGNVFCWTTPDEIHNALDQTTLEQKD